MSLDRQKFLAYLKKVYNQPKIDSMLLLNSPFLGLIDKKKDGGEDINQPIAIGAVQNRSASHSKSINGTNTSKQIRFKLEKTQNFNAAKIDHFLLKTSEESSGSFRNAVTHEVEAALLALKRDISLNLFLKSDGVIGKIAAKTDPSGGEFEITLPNNGDVVYFEIGMNLKASDPSDLDTVRAAEMEVIALDHANNKIVVKGTDTALEVNDVLYVDGDLNSKIFGLSDWLPFGSGRASVLAETFCGVKRSKDDVKLGGVYVDGTTKDIGQALREAMARSALYGIGKPEVVFMNPLDVHILENELEGRVTLEKLNAKGSTVELGYDAIRVGGVGGGAKIVPDAGCPRGVAFCVNLKSFKYYHLGARYVNTWNEDGLDMIRSNDSNDLEAKMYSYGNVLCNAPGSNAVVYFGVRD